MPSLRTALTYTFAASVLAGGLITGATPVGAAAGPVFTVMNTSESLPDGVYFRNSPHTSDTPRITGLGVYQREQVRAKCFLMGDAVGSYGNQVWYLTDNVTRPSAAGRPNSGWLNTHYVDDGMRANQVAPGVPSCNAAPPTPTPTPGNYAQNTAYYSGLGSAGAGTARTLNLGRVLTADGSYDGRWTSGTECVPNGNATAFAGKNITRLAGYSLGRLGPIYALRQLKNTNNTAQAKKIDYVVLFDPGSWDKDFGGCDLPSSGSVQADQTLLWWLRQNPDARLVVMSGNLTATDSHRSIQKNYFRPLKDAGDQFRKRVLVCNYSLGHDMMWSSFATMMTKGRLSTTQGMTSCPTAPGGSQVWGWNP
ncbi:hypothetical protein [Streptomyces sp. NPDC002104]